LTSSRQGELAVAAAIEDYDPLRDSRHKAARTARDQADWLAWLSLGGTAARTLEDYEWITARLLRMFPRKTLAEIAALEPYRGAA
jgi:hypothetical protein